MNLVIVDKCTNYCSYCFASTEMAKNDKRAELSHEAIQEVVSFIRHSGPQFSLNIIGGEPFLYRDMDYLLEQVCSESALGMVTIFTGGIFNVRMLDRILPFQEKVSLLFNLNERRDYKNQADYDVVLRNMAYALKLGIRLNIGFNIWREDFDYDEILAVCHEFGVEHLRWTVAYPEAKPMPGVTVLQPDTYSTVAQRCFDFLEAAYRRNIHAYLDCPLPKCFFKPEALGRILLIQPKSATAIQSCGPAVDVGPDLSVFRCYALSGYERRNLTEFKNYDELETWFHRTIDDRYERPQVYEACKTCEFAEDRSCYGGCMAHSVQSIGQRPSVVDLMRTAHGLLTTGNWLEAEKTLDRLPRQDAAAALLRAHINLQRKDESEALHWARMAVNRSRTENMRQKTTTLLAAIQRQASQANTYEKLVEHPKAPIELPIILLK